MAHFSHSQTPAMVAPLHLTQALQSWRVALWNSVWPCHCTHPLQDGTKCQRKHGRWGWWQLHFQLENVHQLGLPHWQPRDSRQQVCIHHHQLQGKLNSPLLLETLPAHTNGRDLKENMDIYSASLHMNKAWCWSMAAPASMTCFP